MLSGMRLIVNATVGIPTLGLNIDVASNEEAEYEIFESPEGEHSEKGNAA